MPPPFGSHVSGGVPVGVCCAVVLGTALVVVAATVGVVPMMVLVDRVGVVAALAVDEATGGRNDTAASEVEVALAQQGTPGICAHSCGDAYVAVKVHRVLAHQAYSC